MCDQETIECWKLVVEIATLLSTIVIALAGFRISKALQDRNEISQRKSSWLEKWADDFYKTASSFNESATSFLFLYLRAEWDETGDSEKGGTVDIEKLSPDPSRSLELIRELNLGWHEMYKFFGFAVEKGEGLKTAASNLLTEALTWHKSGAGDVTAFRNNQMTFNKNFMEVHAELLELKDSK